MCWMNKTPLLSKFDDTGMHSSIRDLYHSSKYSSRGQELCFQFIYDLPNFKQQWWLSQKILLILQWAETLYQHQESKKCPRRLDSALNAKYVSLNCSFIVFGVIWGGFVPVPTAVILSHVECCSLCLSVWLSDTEIRMLFINHTSSLD